jgi:hypothetical protein
MFPVQKLLYAVQKLLSSVQKHKFAVRKYKKHKGLKKFSSLFSCISHNLIVTLHAIYTLFIYKSIEFPS